VVLAKFEEVEARWIRMMLFAAYLGPRQLTLEQAKRIWPQLDTRINLTDFVISSLSALLKAKTRRVNVDIATLLTAAGVPGGKPGTFGWSAEVIKKRRERLRKNVRNPLLVSIWGPRFLLKRHFIRLYKLLPPE
jgi:hypothetical protein